VGLKGQGPLSTGKIAHGMSETTPGAAGKTNPLENTQIDYRRLCRVRKGDTYQPGAPDNRLDQRMPDTAVHGRESSHYAGWISENMGNERKHADKRRGSDNRFRVLSWMGGETVTSIGDMQDPCLEGPCAMVRN